MKKYEILKISLIFYNVFSIFIILINFINVFILRFSGNFLETTKFIANNDSNNIFGILFSALITLIFFGIGAKFINFHVDIFNIILIILSLVLLNIGYKKNNFKVMITSLVILLISVVLHLNFSIEFLVYPIVGLIFFVMLIIGMLFSIKK